MSLDLAEDPGFAAGTHTGEAATVGGNLTLVNGTLDKYEYFNDFSSGAIAAPWQVHPWASWSIASGGGSADGMALVHSGTTRAHITWSLVLPAPLVEADIAFDYSSEANGRAFVYASPTGAEGSQTLLRASGYGAAQATHMQDLSALLAGSNTVFIQVEADARAGAESGAAIDNFRLTLRYPRVDANITTTIGEPFDGAARVSLSWMTPETMWWGVYNLTPAEFVPPMLVHEGKFENTIYYQLNFPTAIRSANVSLVYSCEANARAEVSVGSGSGTLRTFVGGIWGQGYSLITEDVTPDVSGFRSLELAFHALAQVDQYSFCFFDNVTVTLSRWGAIERTRDGVWESPVLSFNGTVALDRVEATASIPEGAGLSYFYRARVSGGPWSDWSPLGLGTAGSVPASDDFQVRVGLHAAPAQPPPVLHAFALTFGNAFSVEASVNGGPWLSVGSAGMWSATLPLEEGWNEVVVRARDAAGSNATVTVRVFVNTTSPQEPVPMNGANSGTGTATEVPGSYWFILLVAVAAAALIAFTIGASRRRGDEP